MARDESMGLYGPLRSGQAGAPPPKQMDDIGTTEPAPPAKQKLDPGLIANTNKVGAMMEGKTPMVPGDYVWSDAGNVDAGGEQYHYNIDSRGMVQFRSPITGKKIVLGPNETSPSKQRAYQAIMKQVSQATLKKNGVA